MALGKRKPRQEELFIPAAKVVTGPGHPFYTKLNAVLAEAGFDELVERLCRPYYKQGGRPGIPPGVYFRMLFIGYFEGLDSQRGIAWRCADSLALRTFLGLSITEATPVHASMTIIRQRLPEKIFDQVFVFVLNLLEEKGLLRGQTVAVDATTLEANAAMKSIVRKDTGQDWEEYLRGLARAEGIQAPTAEDLRRLDRGRKDKKVSNEHWESRTDPDSRVARMKDGRTHLAYKAEHAVDLESEAILAGTVTPADLRARGVRTYVPERRQKHRCWTNKPAAYEPAFRANRRRVRGARGRRLNRWRSERCERTIAHVCETGGGRRAWVRGLVNVSKVHLLKCAAYNLGLLLRKLWGYCKPRNAEEGKQAGIFAQLAMGLSLLAFTARGTDWITTFCWVTGGLLLAIAIVVAQHRRRWIDQKSCSLTGC